MMNPMIQPMMYQNHCRSVICLIIVCLLYSNSIINVDAVKILTPVSASYCNDEFIRTNHLMNNNKLRQNKIKSFDSYTNISNDSTLLLVNIHRGGGYLPAGWNPMGYKITSLGETYLSFGDSLLSDIGRFIASLKSSRKRISTIKDSWLEIVRASKTGQAMRIYRTIDELIDFCLKAGLID